MSTLFNNLAIRRILSDRFPAGSVIVTGPDGRYEVRSKNGKTLETGNAVACYRPFNEPRAPHQGTTDVYITPDLGPFADGQGVRSKPYVPYCPAPETRPTAARPMSASGGWASQPTPPPTPFLELPHSKARIAEVEAGQAAPAEQVKKLLFLVLSASSSIPAGVWEKETPKDIVGASSWSYRDSHQEVFLIKDQLYLRNARAFGGREWAHLGTAPAAFKGLGPTHIESSDSGQTWHDDPSYPGIDGWAFWK
jgi:hypothetical protein